MQRPPMSFRWPGWDHSRRPRNVDPGPIPGRFVVTHATSRVSCQPPARSRSWARGSPRSDRPSCGCRSRMIASAPDFEGKQSRKECALVVAVVRELGDLRSPWADQPHVRLDHARRLTRDRGGQVAQQAVGDVPRAMHADLPPAGVRSPRWLAQRPVVEAKPFELWGGCTPDQWQDPQRSRVDQTAVPSANGRSLREGDAIM